MSDLSDKFAHIHEKVSITLPRHNLRTLATLCDQEALRYIAKARRKNAAPYSISTNIKTAASYRSLAMNIRSQTDPSD